MTIGSDDSQQIRALRVQRQHASGRQTDVDVHTRAAWHAATLANMRVPDRIRPPVTLAKTYRRPRSLLHGLRGRRCLRRPQARASLGRLLLLRGGRACGSVVQIVQGNTQPDSYEAWKRAALSDPRTRALADALGGFDHVVQVVREIKRRPVTRTRRATHVNLWPRRQARERRSTPGRRSRRRSAQRPRCRSSGASDDGPGEHRQAIAHRAHGRALKRQRAPQANSGRGKSGVTVTGAPVTLRRSSCDTSGEGAG